MFLAPARGTRLYKSTLTRSCTEISRHVRRQHQSLLKSRVHSSIGPPSRCFSISAHDLDASISVPENEQSSQTNDFLDAYKQTFSSSSLTHDISSLDKVAPGTSVNLHGYLGPCTNLSKNFSFAALISKDLKFSVQIISRVNKSHEGSLNNHSTLRALNEHSPVSICGKVQAREPPKDEVNSAITRIRTIEVALEGIIPLNEFPADIDYLENTKFPPEQRHLQIRSNHELRNALVFRSRAANICRDELAVQNEFLEIETPMLFKSTPEGAREFLVPTRTKGLAYALPQSPQQYKQILMASGIPRYFQIARCFRDEDLRADRQPEFTQLDLEMAFSTGTEVKTCITSLIRRLWKELLGIDDLPETFPTMAYQEAMMRYGSDKPDIRLGMEISRIDYLLPVDLIGKIGPLSAPIVDIMKIHVSDSPQETRKFVMEFMDSPESIPFNQNPDGQPGIFIFDSRKPLQGLTPFGFEAAERAEEVLQLEDGDLVVIQARKDEPLSGGSTMMGQLRLALHKKAVSGGYIEPPKGFEFLWITDFPLFSPNNDTDPGQGGAAGFSSTHHPFTAPKTIADVDLLSTDPAKVTAEHYDIVVNGVELGGGSRRIHNHKVQEFIMRDVLKMSEERLQDFEHLLEVLRAGCPPHAGIALGFDRLIAVMLGRESVRDVIAFPKSGKGEDMLVKAPNMVTKEQLDTYHLELKK